jgi:hypothetical protein
MPRILRMTDLDLAGKRVLIREDLNVPVKDGEVGSERAGKRRGGDGDLAPGPPEGRPME